MSATIARLGDAVHATGAAMTPVFSRTAFTTP
jgi:hypothetical protein